MTEQKRLGVEDTQKTFESERDVDFSCLHCDDVETLKSYLTADQASILDQSVLSNPLFWPASVEKLEAVVSGWLWHCEWVGLEAVVGGRGIVSG